MKNLLKTYDIFKSNNKYKETESISDISRATKKVLTNKINYRNYFIDYTRKTEVYTFKSPGITHYPLLQKKSSSLLPIHKKNFIFYEDVEKNRKETEKNEEISLFNKKSKFMVNSFRDSFYKKKMKQNLNISKILFKNKLFNIEKSKDLNKNNQRYNLLISDFFHKWSKDKSRYNTAYIDKKNNNNVSNSISINKNYKHILSEKYSELKYDDNLIFNTNYTPFVNERLEFILLNNIENVETKLESKFNDYNENEIKLRLESIKLNFQPIRSKIAALSSFSSKEKKNKITLHIPLYFTFIFCLKDVDFFKYILLSCITFTEDEKIIFNEAMIKPALKAIFTQKKEEKNQKSKNHLRNSGIINTLNKKSTTSTNLRRTLSKPGSNFKKSSGEKKGNNGVNINSSKVFNMARNSILDNSPFEFRKHKKEEIIHSNKRYKNYFYSDVVNDRIGNDISKINNRKEINQYDEYEFIWETIDKTFLVNIQMPLIYFNYKNLKEEIATYCDKSLFLYMYKNNFINWDFYSLNFLFSLKLFRKRILQNYSLAKNNIILPKHNLEHNLYGNKFLKNLNKKTEIRINSSSSNIKSKIDNNGEVMIVNKDKNKIYNMINDNNESYVFFYTDEFHQNTLIKVYSYIISIDYDKLNPKIRWKYVLNFKLMKLLNEISKYEPLETFLPKITKTDFQNGTLSIDFSVFNEFNIDILGYEKKDLSNNNIHTGSNSSNSMNNTRNKIAGLMSSYTKENNELLIEIKFPSLKQEKIIKQENDNILFKKINTDLDINFLQNLNRYKMDFWSKQILEEINIDNNQSLYSNKLITPHISDNIKKVKTNNVSDFSPWGNTADKINKKFMKKSTFNLSNFQ